jgi:thiamine-phosphate pyrophosphorylase
VTPTLPRLLLVTDRHQVSRPLVDVLAETVAAGIRMILIRERDLPHPERLRLAARVAALVAPVDGVVLLAGAPRPGEPVDLAARVHGRHLATLEPWPEPGPGPEVAPGILGRSCHGTEEVLRAGRRGADYVTLSPIYPTRSKPGYGPALGTAVLAGPAPVPVYALGGIDTPARVRHCLRAGAAGAAVMGAVMRSHRPGALVSRLLAEVDQ